MPEKTPTPELTPEQKRDELLKQIATSYNVTPERAAQILVVMTARNVSPASAIDLLESERWHKEVFDRRKANKPATAPAVPVPPVAK